MASSSSKIGDKVAVPPPVDSDEDEDDFFVIRRRPVAKAPPPAPRPTTVTSADIVLLSSGSESEESPRKKKQKPRATPVKSTATRTSARASSTESSSQRHRRGPSAETSSYRRRRGDTAERAHGFGTAAEPLLLSDDMDDTEKRSAPSTRRRVDKSPDLTPPPELPEDTMDRIKQVMQGLSGHDEREAVVVLSDSEPEVVAGPPPVSSRGQKVSIKVRMVADPERKRKRSSETAIRAYEKLRHFELFSNDPISMVLSALADRMEKLPEDLLLVYDNIRIFSTSRTPSDLGIIGSAEMEGYELSTWEAVQEEKRKARLNLYFNEEPSSPVAGPSGEGPSSPPPVAAAAAPIDRVRLRLRGAAGEVAFAAGKSTKVSTICRYYCSKFNLDMESADKMKLMFDGEGFGGESSVEDMELENGDLVDVE